MDADLSRRIVELTTQRRELRQSIKEKSQGSPAQTQAPMTASKAKPKVVSNVQVAPPRQTTAQRPQNQQSQSQSTKLDTENAPNPMEWETVESKKKKQQQRKKTKQQQQQQQRQQPAATSANANKKTEGKPDKTAKRRRPPRTAAVAIKGTAEGFSYAAALKKLRDEIKLPELDIENSRIRHAASGGLLIEVPGKDKANKAELLKEKVCGILGEAAVVTRPVIKGEIRLIGLDDSVVTDEVADVIAATGGCMPNEVKVGIIRPMTNGLFTVWAQCPLAAANKASQSGKIKIGWTIARIELLKARPTQCFKCWGHGHLRIKCTSTIDRSRTCYRCGIDGHPALTCTNPVRCILCSEQGKNSAHRVGTASCKADFKMKSGSPPEIPEPMETDDTGRRPEEMTAGDVQPTPM